jgi:ElaB/YqjD/DUF883 family membrane-anchored ribosome-binding protein
MPDQSTPYTSGPTESAQGSAAAAKKAKEKVTDVADAVKDKATEWGQNAQKAIDRSREPAASTLDSAASKLHQSAEYLPGGEKVSTLAHQTAAKLQGTADYVRDHDTNAMMKDVEHFVTSHPAQALVAAAVLGFLVGRVFQRD